MQAFCEEGITDESSPVEPPDRKLKVSHLPADGKLSAMLDDAGSEVANKCIPSRDTTREAQCDMGDIGRKG